MSGRISRANPCARSDRKDSFSLSVYLLLSLNSIITIPIQIGNPPIIYSLQLDTASSDLLLASSLCTPSSCPNSPDPNELYHPGRSNSFQSINNNGTGFNLTFGDGTHASGFLASEDVGVLNSYLGGDGSGSRNGNGNAVLPEINGLDGFALPSQLFGLINSTTLGLKEEGMQGVLGLGFPRGTGLGRALARAEGLITGQSVNAAGSTTGTTSSVLSGTRTTSATALMSTSSVATSTYSAITDAQATPTGPTQTSTSAINPTPYYPSFLQNLFSTDLLYYPIFAIGLSNSSGVFSSKTEMGTITFGGVSGDFVEVVNGTTDGSGRTVDDIEWWDVVPFARVKDVVPSTSNASATATSTTSATTATTTTSQVSWFDNLEGEEYLYWALELSNVTMNGTNIPLTSTYNISTTGRSSSIALLDVGSNGIYGPQQDLIQLFSQIQDARIVSDGQWAVPCSTSQTMTFSFGPRGRVIELQPSEWMIGVAQGGLGGMCLAWPVVGQPSQDGVDWQLGLPVLRKVYTIFGYGVDGIQNPVIGFLPLPDPVPVTETNSTSNATVSGTATVTMGKATASIMTSNMSTRSTSMTSITTRDPTNPTPISVQNPSQILAALTVTIGTTLPNQLLPNPTYTTPSYAFETTSIPTLGQIQSSGLANATAYPSVLRVEVISPSAVSVGTSGTSTIRGLMTQSAVSSKTSKAERRLGDGWEMGLAMTFTGLMIGGFVGGNHF